MNGPGIERDMAPKKVAVGIVAGDKKTAAAAITVNIDTANGGAILDEISTYLTRFIAYPSAHCLVAHALWIAHTHLMDAWDSTPRLAVLSPEPGSGKSRVLEVTELLVPRAVEAVNVTPAYLFRKVSDSQGRPTILYDEIDTVFGPKAKDNEEIRGLLNAGHRKHSVAGRCVVRGKEIFTEEIPAYCAVALAGLGGLPDTILSRSIIIRMRRRAPGEIVEPYRRRVNGPEAAVIRERLAAWADSIEANITGVFPDMPAGIVDRDADVWEALIAIADAAGGEWPNLARVAAVALVADSKGGSHSLGVQLLTDLKAIFGNEDALSTEHILTLLVGTEELCWGDIRGKPLDARGLSTRLRQYGVKPTTVRIGGSTPKGYRREDLHDSWVRYVPLCATHLESATSATSATTDTPGPLIREICQRCSGEGCGHCAGRK